MGRRWGSQVNPCLLAALGHCRLFCGGSDGAGEDLGLRCCGMVHFVPWLAWLRSLLPYRRLVSWYAPTHSCVRLDELLHHAFHAFEPVT